MRPNWKITLDASKQEAIFAVDIYNQSKHPRQLEAYLVHMHLAWLYLMQAKYKKSGTPYHYKRANGRNVYIDGEKMSWELAKFVENDNDLDAPIKSNLELTIKLRNKIEHRYQQAIVVATAGYCQSLLLNFETELCRLFGNAETLGELLRFPIYIGSITTSGASRTLAIQSQVPSKMRDFLKEFQGNLPSDIVNDQRFEFRVNLIPKTSPKADADLAITYIREDELTPEQLAAFSNNGSTATVIVKDQIREVANRDLLKPGVAQALIESKVPFKFPMHDFVQAYKKLKIRPGNQSTHPERTDSKYCIYDEPNKAYLYKPVYIDMIIEKIGTVEKYTEFYGTTPTLKTQLITEETSI